MDEELDRAFTEEATPALLKDSGSLWKPGTCRSL